MMKKTINVKIKRRNESVVIPSYGTDGSCAMDLVAYDMHYNPDIDAFIYDTGIALEMPEGYGAIIIPKSRNRKTDYYIPNSPGLGDNDYRGYLEVTYKGRDDSNTIPPYKVGEQVAQLYIIEIPKIVFEEVDDLTDTIRGEGGHGSTGEHHLPLRAGSVENGVTPVEGE